MRTSSVVPCNKSEGHSISQFCRTGRQPSVICVTTNGESPVPLCDLVLLDLNLPGITGFEVLETIKSTPHMNTVPVVVMSGSCSVEDIEKSYRTGANSYVSKPAQLEDLLA